MFSFRQQIGRENEKSLFCALACALRLMQKKESSVEGFNPKLLIDLPKNECELRSRLLKFMEENMQSDIFHWPVFIDSTEESNRQHLQPTYTSASNIIREMLHSNPSEAQVKCSGNSKITFQDEDTYLLVS
jgi:hypothetical protein